MHRRCPIDENFFSAEPKKSYSWAWKCILKNQRQFWKGVRWKVDNGMSINFWLDSWCANESLAKMLYVTYAALIDTSLKVSHFITCNNEWNVAKLQPLVGRAQLQLILTILISFNPIPDLICWGLSQWQIYTSRLGGVHLQYPDP